MPRKTNETIKKENNKKNTVVKKDTTKVSKKATRSATKKVAKATTTKKTTKPSTSKKAVSKTSTAKKAPSKSGKTNSTKKLTKSKVKPEMIEYYDLPYRYNQTVVKILAQTPNTLFVYWDISDEDKEKYITEYGKDFFEKTIPVLIIHNKTKNYSFEIEVNDFANSWYFNVNDADSLYEIEFGRRPRPQSNIIIPNDYLQIISSNKIEAPNDHILFEKEQKNVFFRNVKTNVSYSKNIVRLNFMKKIGTIYSIYDVYKKIYKNENLEDIKNPSSY